MNVTQETHTQKVGSKDSHSEELCFEVELSDEQLDMTAAVSDILDLLEFLVEHEESPVSTPKHVEKIDSFCDGLPAEDFPSSDTALE